MGHHSDLTHVCLEVGSLTHGRIQRYSSSSKLYICSAYDSGLSFGVLGYGELPGMGQAKK